MPASKPLKTLAMRVLEGHKVPYSPVYYEVIDHLSAAEVAAAIGLPPEQTFKTLVVLPERTPGRPILALVPGDSQLDLKKLAAAAGEKKVPLALLDRGWPIFVDETIILFDRVEISAGKVGVGVVAEVEGLLRVLAAQTADLTAA